MADLPDALEILSRAPVGFCRADELNFAWGAVQDLVLATRAMNRLAKGPPGGVSQQQKREVIALVDSALEKFGGPK